jgi:hypothetical protein
MNKLFETEIVTHWWSPSWKLFCIVNLNDWNTGNWACDALTQTRHSRRRKNPRKKQIFSDLRHLTFHVSVMKQKWNILITEYDWMAWRTVGFSKQWKDNGTFWSSLKTDLRFARPKIRGSTERFALSVDPLILGRAKRRSVFRLILIIGSCPGWHGKQWYFQNNEKTIKHSDHWIMTGWHGEQWDFQNNERQ